MTNPTLNKQHFALIAQTLKDTQPHQKREGDLGVSAVAWNQWIVTVETFVNNLKETNDLFDEKKFLEACGFEE